MEEKLVTILNEMAEYLSIAQMKKLQEVLLKNLAENEPQKAEISNAEYLQMFLDAKKIEGCSERTLQYYRVTVERMLQSTTTPIRKICTEEIRSYLSGYQQINGCGKVTVDNIRRNISSFFSWLEEEDYIKYFAAADYSEGRELDTLVKAIIDRTAYNEKLETMHYKNLNEAAASEEK